MSSDTAATVVIVCPDVKDAVVASVLETCNLGSVFVRLAAPERDCDAEPAGQFTTAPWLTRRRWLKAVRDAIESDDSGVVTHLVLMGHDGCSRLEDQLQRNALLHDQHLWYALEKLTSAVTGRKARHLKGNPEVSAVCLTDNSGKPCRKIDVHHFPQSATVRFKSGPRRPSRVSP